MIEVTLTKILKINEDNIEEFAKAILENKEYHLSLALVEEQYAGHYLAGNSTRIRNAEELKKWLSQERVQIGTLTHT